MTQRILWILVISTTLVLSGCDTQEQPNVDTTPHPVVKPDKPIQQEEKVAEAVQAIEKTEPTVAEREDVTAPVKKTVEGIAETANETAKTTAATIQETVKASEEKAEVTEDKIEQDTSAIAAPPSMPEVVQIEASYGKVTLPHATHAKAYECSICHGASVPGAMTLGKDAAHALCKGCHKDEGAGPTGCNGCHVK